MVMDNPENDNNALSIIVSLSSDELAFLLNAVGIPRLPGFEMPGDYSDLHAEVAARSLMAKDILSLNAQGGYEANSGVVDIITAGLNSDRLLAMSTVENHAPQEYWYYLSNQMIVEHVSIPTGVERFQVLNNGLQFAFLLSQLMGMNIEDKSAPGSEQVTIEKALYDRARSLARSGDVRAAHSVLMEAGVDTNLAGAIVDPLQHFIFTSYRNIEANVEPMGAILVLKTEPGFWVVLPDGEARVVAVPMNGEQVLAAVADMVQPA